MASSLTSLGFKVDRRQPELIPPAKPTPYEFKPLSDIDDQGCLRFQIPVMQFYPKNVKMEGIDPVKVIREAVAKALVYYYPFAGRLFEGSNGKLIVECTGEGVMFIEADADIRLEDFGNSLRPPFPGLEELLYRAPGSTDVVGCPLLLIQVTRLICGGFIFAIRLNHTMSDAGGLLQFMNAVAEMARGLSVPSVEPVWNRELLNARNPPRLTCPHHVEEHVVEEHVVEEHVVTSTEMQIDDDMVHGSFFFGTQEFIALRKHLPSYLRACSTFEILTACIWRCRTIALNVDPTERVRLLFSVNASKMFNPPLPVGYYGNTFAFPVAASKASELCQNPLDYALQLIKKAKEDVTEEYIRSFADLMVIKGRPHIAAVKGTYLVSDVRRAGFSNVDFGWGKAVYGGPAKGDVGTVPGVASFYIPTKNNRGENGIVVPISLPKYAMDRFAVELERIMNHKLSKL